MLIIMIRGRTLVISSLVAIETLLVSYFFSIN